MSLNRWSEDVIILSSTAASGEARRMALGRQIVFLNKATPQMQDKFTKLAAKRLKDLRKGISSHSRTQRELGISLNFSRQYYSRIENGKIPFWKNMKIINKLSSELNCTQEYLLLMTNEKFGVALYDENVRELVDPIGYYPELYKFPKTSTLDSALHDLFAQATKIDEEQKLLTIRIMKEILSKHENNEKIINVMKFMLPKEEK